MIFAVDTFRVGDKFFFNEIIDDWECHSKIYWGKDDKGVYYIVSQSINPVKESLKNELYDKFLGEKQVENPWISDLEEIFIIFPLDDERCQVTFITNMNFGGSLGHAISNLIS